MLLVPDRWGIRWFEEACENWSLPGSGRIVNVSRALMVVAHIGVLVPGDMKEEV